MVCIHCGHKKTQVTNSRPHKSAASVWRRRFCPNCQNTVTTYEMVASQYLPLITYPNPKLAPERFNTFRLALSFSQMLAEDDEQAAQELAITVAQKIIAAGHHEIALESLIDYSYQTLVNFDKTAGMQYGVRYGAIKLP